MSDTAAPGGPRDGHLLLRIPVVDGDPAAVRRLAAAHAELADVERAVLRAVDAVLDEVTQGWRGRGAAASHDPADRIGRAATALSRQSDRVAGTLSTYADQLAKAQQHHGWSLGRIAALGGIVVVTGAACLVTMGAAGAVAGAEVGAVAGAAEEATAAAGAAAEAAGEAADGLDAVAGALAAIRPIAAFVLPHLVQGELNAGVTAATEEIESGRLDGRDIGDGGFVGFGSSAAGDSLDETVAPYLSRLSPDGRMGARLAIAAASGAAGTAAQDALDGQPIRVRDLLSGAGQGAAGGAWRERHAPEPGNGRHARPVPVHR